MVIYISSRRVLILYIQRKYVLACAGIIAFVDWDGERNAFMIALNYYYYVRRVWMKCINRMMNCTICSPVVCGELILWVIMEWYIRFQYKLHYVTWTVIQHIVRSCIYCMIQNGDLTVFHICDLPDYRSSGHINYEFSYQSDAILSEVTKDRGWPLLLSSRRSVAATSNSNPAGSDKSTHHDG